MEDYMKKLIVLARLIAVVTVALFAVVTISFGILIPRVSAALAHAEDMLSNAETTLSKADSLISAANESLMVADKAIASANAAADSANQLMQDNTEAVTNTMQKINSIDFESLNKAITDLKNIVSSLSRATNIFN